MRKQRRLAVGLAVLLASSLASAGPARAAVPPLALAPAFAGLANPVFVTHAGDGSNRLFIVEQAGVIKVAQPGASTTTQFLNLALRITSGGERGLLGLAFHPAYETNRRFYVYYTRLSDGDVVISEFRVTGPDPNVADPNSERVLAIIEHSQFANHNGGMLAFGPDGRLYAGVGDGGSANDPNNHAQTPGDPLGKIIRLDADAAAPAIEIHALGFRNPWRFSFDRADGTMFVGDVGQGAREEIDVVTQGGNYGWRVLEGTACTGLGPGSCTDPQYIPPIVEYGHTGGRCSVTGGYVYRGSAGAMPAGTYLFGDYCSGEIFVNEGGVAAVALDTSFSVSSFGEDEAGELYVVNLGGSIHKFVPAGAPGACQPPSGPVSGLLYGLDGGLAALAVAVCELGL